MRRVLTPSAWEGGLVAASLAAITLVAWLYLLHIAGQMTGEMPAMDMGDMMAPAHPQSALTRIGLTALMWAAMMTGMMLPSAIPMVLLFAAVQRRHAAHPTQAVAVFVAGYLLVWGGFSIVAALLQDVLASAMLLSPSLSLVEPWAGGALFLAAGLYELSPVKRRCLDQCRGPVAFIAARWRPSLRGALRMGLEHGALCLGCCWVMMLLLFVGGVMNLVWVAALAVIVMAQKLVPGGAVLARAGGILLTGLGVALLIRPWLG